MKKILVILYAAIALLSCLLDAAEIRDVTVTSASMNKQITNMVITPERRSSNEHFPVVYLLHGYNMTPRDWLHVQPQLPDIADHLRLIIVCPDGNNSWYVDSPVNPTSKYETYVAKELVEYVDSHLPTIRDRRARALCGLSMGGFGSLRLAILHQDTFSAAGSMSGLVDFSPFPNRWGTAEIFGKVGENDKHMQEFSILNLARFIRPGLSIMFDCGTADFFHQINENLHRHLLDLRIPHTYVSAPGTHNFAYWNTALIRQLIFLSHHFADHTAVFSD